MLNLLMILHYTDFASPVKVTDERGNPIYIADEHDEVVLTEATIRRLSGYLVTSIYADEDVICIKVRDRYKED